MQEAVPAGEGAMAAILGLEDEKVRGLCSEAAAGEVVEAVNYNSPGQVVVAGSSSAVERLIELAKSAGAKRALKLPVSVPSHCALMKPAAEKLAARLEEVELQMPAIPVLHNVTVAPAADVSDLRRQLAQQLYSPVRWVETVQRMAGQGSDIVLEMGPGKVLTGLNKRIDRNIKGLAVFDADGLESALEATPHVE
ncbi:MAG TPA: ACP S-malonyltransferase, partial [Chromatiales bacterium]|nr:ACP S-malonyltransferase [Chromatiales bacterium]